MMKTQTPKQRMASKKKIMSLKKKIKGYQKQVTKLEMAKEKLKSDYNKFAYDKKNGGNKADIGLKKFKRQLQMMIEKTHTIHRKIHYTNIDIYRLEKGQSVMPKNQKPRGM